MTFRIHKHRFCITRSRKWRLNYLNEAGLAATQIGPIIIEYWTS